jgi:3-oxoacyl-[acyl-carrier protein] reductase
VRNSDQVDDLVAQTLHIYGVPDILVNSAGVGFRAPLLETSAEHWDAIHDTLLRGTFLTTRSVVQHMQERKQGNIINIGAPIERLALPNFAAYCAAKYGVEGLTRALAKELRRSGINVNALHPGTHADTRMKQVLAPEANKGIVSPDSVSEAAVFLAQQPPRGTSGEIINTQTWSPPA